MRRSLPRLALPLLAAALVFSSGCAAPEREECGPGGSCAAEFPQDVVGRDLEEACKVLGRSQDLGVVLPAKAEGSVTPGRVLEQDPKPGARGQGHGKVRLVVAEPFPKEALPPDGPCVRGRQVRPVASD